MDLQECIHGARTVRYYRSQQVPEDVMLAILQSGRASGSGKNRQPWHFILVRDREQLQRLSTTGDYTAHLAAAALAVVICIPEHPVVPSVAWIDAGRAAQNMVLSAHDHGVGSCLMVFRADPPKARAVLGLPGDRQIAIAIAFGYPDRSRVDEERNFQQRVLDRSGRRPLAEIVTENTFDGPHLTV